MSTTKLARSTSLFIIFAVGCTGLDPGAFGARDSPSEEPEGAGWSFDAGTAPDAGGRGGTTSVNRAGSGEAARGGRGAEPADGGEGSADDGGAGTADGAGSGGQIGAGGRSSNAGSAGLAGRGLGGAGGRAGSGAGGTRAGAGGRAAAGGPAGGVSGASTGGAPATHAVFFSEYVEGSSSYKALEIQAREPSTLAGCRLVTYFNGSSTGTGLALDGALDKGGVTTLCTTALAAVVGTACHRATNLTFNGDDALALECEGTTLDVIGQIGTDPGDAWSSAGASTLNQTLRRRCAARSGDQNGADAFDPALDWEAFPVDAFDGLGSAECSEN